MKSSLPGSALHRTFRLLVFLGLTVWAPSVLATDSPFRIFDLESSPEARQEPCAILCPPLLKTGSFPQQLTPAGDRLFFVAFTEASGEELWVSDGTEAGTRQVRDFCPGECDAEYVMLGAVDDRLLFLVVHGGSLDSRLWVSDGTPEGTRPLPGACDGGCAPRPHQAVDRGDALFLSLRDRLWRTDGTPAGTRAIRYRPTADATVRPVRPVRSEPALTLLEGRLYIQALEADSGVVRTLVLEAGETVAEAVDHCLPIEPHRTSTGFVFLCDGVLMATIAGPREATPVPVAGLPPAHSITPEELVGTLGNDIYYLVDDSTAPGGPDEFTLWRTDSVGGEPVRIDSLATGHVKSPFLWNGQIFVETSPGLWTLDLANGAGFVQLYAGEVIGLHALDQVLLYFSPEEFTPGVPEAYEVWASNGSPQGTRIVFDDIPGHIRLFRNEFARLGDHLYFRADDGVHGEELASFPLALVGEGPCVAAPDTLCLGEGRFAVRVRFENQHDGAAEGVGTAIPATPDAGFFWFFRESNLELVVKVLDGTGVNGHHWVFYGGITDLEYDLEVTDLETGLSRTFHHAPGDLCGGADTTAFPSTAADLARAAAAAHPSTAPRWTGAPLTPAPCGTTESLCLPSGGEEFFQIEATFRNQYADGAEGVGRAVRQSPRGGYFWFFREDNPELMVKILDGRSINGHWWVFLGGLTTLETTVTVRDTGRPGLPPRIYTKPAESTCGGVDFTAFPAS